MNGELTGYRRFRVVVGKLGGGPWALETGAMLVLQVEYNTWVDTEEGKPGRWVCEWRDATPADITSELVI